MIQLVHDNLLVTEVHKDSKAGALLVNQDESSAYMFVQVEQISREAMEALGIVSSNDSYYLVVQRTAKLPFIQNKFFISHKDVIAIVDRDYFEEL